jgi:hypothetical protein
LFLSSFSPPALLGTPLCIHQHYQILVQRTRVKFAREVTKIGPYWCLMLILLQSSNKGDPTSFSCSLFLHFSHVVITSAPTPSMCWARVGLWWHGINWIGLEVRL